MGHHFKLTIFSFICSTRKEKRNAGLQVKKETSQKGRSRKSSNVWCFISFYTHFCLSMREFEEIRSNLNSVQYAHVHLIMGIMHHHLFMCSMHLSEFCAICTNLNFVQQAHVLYSWAIRTILSSCAVQTCLNFVQYASI